MSGVAAAVVAVALGDAGPGEPRPPTGSRWRSSAQAAGVDASAVVAPEDDGSIIELDASGLDPDVTYSMWLTPPGGGYADRVAAGTFRPDDDGEVEVRLRCALPAEEMGRAWATTSDGEIALGHEAGLGAPGRATVSP